MSLSVYELLASGGPLHALTLHQPWASAVAELHKDVENRTWPPPKERLGRALAVHAGLTYDLPGAQSIQDALGLTPPSRHSCPKGAVVAVAVLTQARKDSPSRWAIPGAVHWCLEGTVALAKPVPCRGAQGLWVLPPTVLEAVREQLLYREAQARAALALSPTEGPPEGLQKVAAEAWAETRQSVRLVHKGSGRGAGPAMRLDVVRVHKGPGSRVCERCNCSRRDSDGPHAPRIMRAPPEGWPRCEHGFPLLVDCDWETPVPGCAWHLRAGAP